MEHDKGNRAPGIRSWRMTRLGVIDFFSPNRRMASYICPMNEYDQTIRKPETGSSAIRQLWSRWFPDRQPSVAHRLYSRLVGYARFPIFYDRLGAPDTPEGRFEILALHVALTIRRLFRLGDDGRAVGQSLFDLMVADLDTNLRELGVGDLSVGKQVKRLTSQFYARLAALDEAFDADDPESLRAVIEKNVYAGRLPSQDQVRHLISILAALEDKLGDQAPSDLMTGRITLLDEAALTMLGERRPQETMTDASP